MKKKLLSTVLVIMLLLTVMITPVSAASYRDYQFKITRMEITPVMYGAVMTPYKSIWTGSALNGSEKNITAWRNIQPNTVTAFYITMNGTTPYATSSDPLENIRFEAIDKWNGNNSYWYVYIDNPSATTKTASFVIPNLGYPFEHDWDNTMYHYTDLRGLVWDYYLVDDVRDTLNPAVNFTFYWQYR